MIPPLTGTLIIIEKLFEKTLKINIEKILKENSEFSMCTPLMKFTRLIKKKKYCLNLVKFIVNDLSLKKTKNVIINI